MGYRYPLDPRLRWEWCPKCQAWWEIGRTDWYEAVMVTAGDCFHGPHEVRLDPLQVRCASMSAEKIEQAFLAMGLSQGRTG